MGVQLPQHCGLLLGITHSSFAPWELWSNLWDWTAGNLIDTEKGEEVVTIGTEILAHQGPDQPAALKY